MKTETNNPLSHPSLLPYPFRFIPFSIIPLVQGVSKHHGTGVAETIHPPPPRTEICLQFHPTGWSPVVTQMERPQHHLAYDVWTIQFCSLSTFLGLTVAMLMMTVTDVMKMNSDFRMFCDAAPINLLCLSVSPSICLNLWSQWKDFD
jgi:hypothetical protein